MSTNFAVNYETQPDQYRHWSWRIDGEIATLSLDIQEDGGILPGYKLKLNSYDLGVDIELNDAVQRLKKLYQFSREIHRLPIGGQNQ